MADPKVRADRTLAPALVKAFEAAKDDDPRVRRYLALAIGRLDPPLPPDAVAGARRKRARRSTDGEIAHQRHLGARLLRRSVGRADAACRSTTSPDDGHPQDGRLRARRAARRRADRRRCARRCRMRRRTCAGTPRSRWRARAATTACRCSGRCSTAQYVEQTVKRDVRQDEDQDPIADVMISGLRAAATLKDDVAQAVGRRR